MHLAWRVTAMRERVVVIGSCSVCLSLRCALAYASHGQRSVAADHGGTGPATAVEPQYTIAKHTWDHMQIGSPAYGLFFCVT